MDNSAIYRVNIFYDKKRQFCKLPLFVMEDKNAAKGFIGFIVSSFFCISGKR